MKAKVAPRQCGAKELEQFSEMLLQKYQCRLFGLNSKANFRPTYGSKFRPRCGAILYDGEGHFNSMKRPWFFWEKPFNAKFLESLATIVLNTSVTFRVRYASSKNAKTVAGTSFVQCAKGTTNRLFNVFSFILPRLREVKTTKQFVKHKKMLRM